MSNDERMIRVENACMEQAIRIEAQQSQINKLDQALANRDTELIMLRKKHNALCDAIIRYGAVEEGEDVSAYGNALRSARIDTGDTEAQDEPQDCENEVDAETEGAETPKHSGLPLRADDTGDADVDAIMGELREETNYNARLKSQRETIDFMLNLVRPHIERLVRERDALAVEIERKWRTERDDLLHFKAFYDKFMESTGHLGHQNGTNETSLYNTLRDIARILTGRNSYVVKKLEGKEQ